MCAFVEEPSSVSPSICIPFACGYTKMMDIIDLVDMYFINIRCIFCSQRFLHEIRLVLDLMYANVKICVIMFVCGDDSQKTAITLREVYHK
jgi:hypothetical protein